MKEEQIPSAGHPSGANNSSMKNTMLKYLKYWPYFILAMVIAAAGAYFYLTYIAHPVYEIRAALEIKGQKKDSEEPSQKSLLKELMLSSPSNIVENEIEILKSMSLIKSVVNDLNLNIVYKEKAGGILYEDLYNQSPVKLTLIEPAPPSNSLNNNNPIIILINDQKSFSVKMPGGSYKRFAFNSILKNHIGTWKLEPTALIDKHIGSKLKINVTDAEKTALLYQEKINAELTNKLTTAIELTINDQIPQRGKDILNQLIYEYNKINKAEKNREIQSTLAFIDQRLASITNQLSNTENNIENFKSSRALTDIPTQAKLDMDSKESNMATLSTINIQLKIIDGIERYVDARPGNTRAPATMGITDPGLISLIERLSVLEVQREKMLATTPATNPDFEAVDRQIASIRSAIKDNVKNLRVSLLATKQQIESNVNRYESTIKDLPVQERQYVNIKRQQSVTENLYLYLLQKREELSLGYFSNLSNERIVDQAYIGPVKSFSKPVIYLLAIITSWGLVIAIIGISTSIKNKISHADEIQEALTVPIISELDYDRSRKRGLTAANTDAPANLEQFRALRVNLHYLHTAQNGGRVTLITSGLPGEGKSFVCKHLGATLAYSGRRTIIVEFDMRKRMSGLLGLSSQTLGISDYLKGTASIDDILKHSGKPNLDVISNGSFVEDSSELLERPLLRELIAWLRTQYDDILIDSPPLRLVADAMILSRFSDITLYVIRQGYTDRSELDFINKLHFENHMSKMNIIFNGIKDNKYSYGYKYGNYYSSI